MPVFVAKHNEMMLQQEQGKQAGDPNNETFEMLGTIKVPLNLR